MLDLDPRVVEGLRGLASRAPQDADVWPAAERYVVKRRRHRHALAGAVAALVVVTGGVVSLGVARHASAPSVGSDPVTTEPGSLLPASGPIEGSLTITASPDGRLAYSPATVTVSTGIYAIGFVDGSNTTHTLEFDDPTTMWSELMVDTQGEVKTSRAFFSHAGDYVFFCVIAGHRAAGMTGVVHVTGPTMTLAQAEAAGSPSYG
jgi:plastocyanin